MLCQMTSNALNTRPRIGELTRDWMSELNKTLPVDVPRP